MSEYMVLMGAEEVRRASHTIDAAAETLRRAASEFSEAVEKLERVLETDRYERMERRR